MMNPPPNPAARYVKLVDWSDEDGCFVGRVPGLVGPCCHGDDQVEVYRELCDIAEEWVRTLREDGDVLPPAVGVREAA